MSPRRRSQVMPAEDNLEVNIVDLQTIPTTGKGLVLVLPPELLEDILVLLAESDSPTTIAALAGTCKALKKLIYCPEDHHLWRRIYLTTFDDPRILVDELEDTSFNWASEYQARIRALLTFQRRSVERVPPGKRAIRQKSAAAAAAEPTAKDPTYDYTSTLEALLSTLHTFLPIPPPEGGEGKRHPWEDPSLSSYILREAARRAPSYPPHLKSQEQPPEAQPANAATQQSTFHTVPPSKNIAFLKRIFSAGIIPDLITLINFGVTPQQPFSQPVPDASPNCSRPSLGSEDGTCPTPSSLPHRYATSEREALNKLIAVLGVSPFLIKPETPDTSDEQNVAQDGSLYRSDLIPSSALHQGSFATQTFRRIRLGAQTEVYRMRYLNPRRAYGPFLRVPMEGEVDDVDASSDEEDANDKDYTPPSDHSGDSDDEPDLEMPMFVAVPRAHRPKPLPSAAELRADWEHLAAIRIVVQAKLEEKMKALAAHGGMANWFEPGRLDDFQRTLLSWENIRTGVWSAGPKNVKSEAEEGAGSDATQGAASSSTVQTPTLPQSPSEPLIEWDWAGVQGMWRRAVCWLDYHDLIFHNTRGFAGASLDEATITVPLTLRVTGFSPSPSPKYKDFPTIHFDSKRFPTIHIEGQMGGAGWAFGDGEDEVRRVKGTVKVCGDGSVWWSMLSCQLSSHQDAPDEWEWASEGVQIGPSLVPGNPAGVRSGCGILGLWTGWEHEPEDPIGAWWQWKVA